MRQEQTCFQEGEGEPNFLLEWAFSWSGLRKCHLPTCLGAEKSQAEIAKNNQHGVLQFPEGIKEGMN